MRRLGRRHAPAEQQHLERDVVGQTARQALDGAGVGHDAHGQLGQRERDVIGGDDQVAGERQLEAAADGEPVERGDHRLV